MLSLCSHCLCIALWDHFFYCEYCTLAEDAYCRRSRSSVLRSVHIWPQECGGVWIRAVGGVGCFMGVQCELRAAGVSLSVSDSLFSSPENSEASRAL